MRYETHVAKEVPAFIEKRYRTLADRRYRAISGLSMGGHGALYIGLRHTGFFGQAGSMSGALVMDSLRNRHRVEKLLGDSIQFHRLYEYSSLAEIDKPRRDSIGIIVDCGTEDYLIEMSRTAHRKMLAQRIPHHYIERPGAHDWKYWAEAVEYQFLFFRRGWDASASLE